MKKLLLIPVALITAAFIACGGGDKTLDENPDTRPNLILILTDDQRWDTLAYMPEVQRHLLEQGVEFTNAFVTTPVCCPTRASILSGQYAHTHGVLRNDPPDGSVTAFDDSSTIATWLHDAGYRTALIGKYLNRYPMDLSPHTPPGWDDWHAFQWGYYDYHLTENGTIIPYGIEEADYSTDVLAAKAVRFIEATDGPFFLYFAPFAPHVPSTPASRHEDDYADLAPFRSPSFNEEDMSDKPTWDRRALSSAQQDSIDKRRILQIQSLQAVDEAVAAIMAALEAAGKDQNTAIIFASDDGALLGEHRLVIGKGCPFEECLRVPLVIRYPAMIAEPRRDSHLVLAIDLAPTLAEIAGIELPASIEGRSMAPLLSGVRVPWRDDFPAEYWRHDPDPGRFTFAAVRSLEWKYIEYLVCPVDSAADAATPSRETELYNILDDPYELTNVYGLAIYPDQEVLEGQLAARLRELAPDWPPAEDCEEK